MKKTTSILLALLLVANTSRSQLAISEMQHDFDLLRSALEEAHGGLYRYSTKQVMDSTFSQFRDRLNKPLKQSNFIGIIAELLATTRDGHLRLDYDDATTAELASAKLFPFRLLIEQDKLRIVLNDTRYNTSIFPGMELVNVNDHPVEKIEATLLPKQPGDGFSQTGRKRMLANGFGKSYHLFIDTSAVFRVTVKDSKGKLITATVEGVLNSEREKNAA